ncbi:sel1 repeat family protein [Amantichitinum ursilacus]|uniref:Sel1 repeat protein n=1 Tax=Amantichitinum ursilacus TaxID=857265 RepID=A0A0N0GNM6_9NEIS|nr:sel1 repeat family protein [Amantichitinum ursilacus]KPC52994.1 hypothetical protein WG78_10905 [Amantichitinum ursilacus]
MTLSEQDKLDYNAAVRMLLLADSGAQPIEQFKQLAARGMGKAAWNVAVAYLRGQRVAVDAAMGSRYMLAAALAGEERAFYPVSRMYMTGLLPVAAGPNAQLQRFVAARWFWRALAQGDPRAWADCSCIHASVMFRCLGFVPYR